MIKGDTQMFRLEDIMAEVSERWELSDDMKKHIHLEVFHYESESNRVGERYLLATLHSW